MTEALIEAGTLTASVETRSVTGLLLPYGEVGNTNLGKFAVDKGTITIPRDPSVVGGNLDHKREHPVARATVLTDTDAGIVATFAIANTDEGDQLLADIAAGTRTKLSAEVRNIVIRAGKAVSGVLFGGAFVPKGAFPSAALMAEDVGDIDAETTETAPVVPETVPDAPATTKEDDVTVATVPNTLGTGTQSTSAPAPLTASDIGGMLYALNQGTLSYDDFAARIGQENGATLFATLSDVKYDGTGGLGGTMGILPQWIGSVWQAVNYRQQVLPLFGHKDLTSLTMNGFKWTTKPSGGDWAGNKAAVPSNTLVVAAVTGAASRYAVGHDIAREFIDFPVPGFFESYASAVSEDYARWADGVVATAVTAGATTLAADALTTLPGPTGGTIGSAASAIIDGATVLVNNGVLPSFALLAPALWKQMAKMPATNVLGYLNAALGLGEGDLDGFVIRPSSSVATGKVLVGAKEAVTVYELPGVPIRVDALDLAKGGIDKAAFGYAGVVINDARGLQLVTAATS
jgi:hypothetical protein